MLTYPNKEEVGLLDLEASAGLFFFKFDLFSIELHLDGYDKLQLIADLHIKIRILKTAVLTRKQHPNDVLNA